MKRFVSIVLAIMLLASISISCFADDVTIYHDKTSAPDYSPYFASASDDMKAAIGIGLNVTGYPSTDIYQAAIRTSLTSDNPPDMFTWWDAAWTQDLASSDLLYPVTDIWAKYSDDISEGMKTASTIDGEQYTIPYTVEYWGIYYNKAVFAELNLEVPETTEEFLAVCDAIKAAGKTPINQSFAESWTAFITFEQLCAGQDPQLYNDLCSGKAKFTDEPARKVFELWKDMMDKEYFTDYSVSHFTDLPRMFNEGELAMIMSGTWYAVPNLIENGVPQDNIGIFFLKDEAGDYFAITEVSPVLISKNSTNLENALKVADYLLSPEGNTFLAKYLSSYPVNSKADTSYLSDFAVGILDTINNNNFTLVTRFWENMPTSLMLLVNEKFSEFIVNRDVETTVTEIQALCDEYFG